jgi:hypothetical protein
MQTGTTSIAGLAVGRFLIDLRDFSYVAVLYSRKETVTPRGETGHVTCFMKAKTVSHWFGRWLRYLLQMALVHTLSLNDNTKA